MFEDIVTGLMKTGTTDAIIVTHGGVIMTLLAIYGLPQAKPFDWVMDGGYGYSIPYYSNVVAESKVSEVFQKIPLPKEDDEE